MNLLWTLISGQCLFFGFILIAARYDSQKFDKRTAPNETKLLKEEVRRLNQKNVELVQENLKHKYRN